MKKIFWIIFATLAIIIGLYPAIYFVIDRKFGLLSSKSPALLNNLTWNIGFYTHIILGGLALLIGWTQFSKSFRAKNLPLHRNIGKIYVLAVLLSGLAGIYIGFFATGGIIAAAGFITLGFIWLYTTLMAYTDVKTGNFQGHQQWMIYSYAACFAAVTLRIWLPILTFIFKDFDPAYRIVAWLSWIPNLLVANWIVKNSTQKELSKQGRLTIK